MKRPYIMYLYFTIYATPCYCIKESISIQPYYTAQLKYTVMHINIICGITGSYLFLKSEKSKWTSIVVISIYKMPTKKETKEVKPIKAKKEEAPKATLSLDDIQKLISASAPKPKAKRKSAEQTDEQKAKMLDRLTLMRQKASENRELRSRAMTNELKSINDLS